MEITKIDTAKEIKDFSYEQMNIFERKKKKCFKKYTGIEHFQRSKIHLWNIKQHISWLPIAMTSNDFHAGLLLLPPCLPSLGLFLAAIPSSSQAYLSSWCPFWAPLGCCYLLTSQNFGILLYLRITIINWLANHHFLTKQKHHNSSRTPPQ